MFEAVTLGRKISKTDYKTQLPALRAALLQAQFALSKTNQAILVIIAGVDGAGRGEVMNALSEWLDTRGLATVSFARVTEDERERPEFWRYWRQLPQRGRIGLFFGAWYQDLLQDHVDGKISDAELNVRLNRIKRQERMLTADGMVIVKIWLHIDETEQKRRLDDMAADPNTKRRVSDTDLANSQRHADFLRSAELMIRASDTGDARWQLMEASEARYRNLSVGRLLLDTLQNLPQHCQLAEDADNEALPALEHSPQADLTVLDNLDLSPKLVGKAYREQLDYWQGRLHQLAWDAQAAGISTVVVFEGADAAGKGGAIRRLTQALDARLYQVISVAAPTDEERAHHYLWRFWRHIPYAGTWTLYDRSWYGRVLVERVEGFAETHAWQRAYSEINEFEDMLIEHGTVLVKCWVHIDPDEQLRRFKEREVVPHKQYKITDEDWRNRERWDDYKYAVNDMVAHTSTQAAPWHLIAGNDKKYARVQVLKTVCEALEKRLAT